MKGLDKPIPEIAQICIHLFDQEISVVEGNFALQEICSQAVQSYKDQLVREIKEEIEKKKRPVNYDTTNIGHTEEEGKIIVYQTDGYNLALDDVNKILESKRG
jgi:hypothetical protein